MEEDAIFYQGHELEYHLIMLRVEIMNRIFKEEYEKRSRKVIRYLDAWTPTKKLQSNDKAFKGLNPVECYFDKGMYKYTTGSSTDYYEIVKLKKRINEKFKDAFIVAFINNERTDTQQAIALFKQTHS